MQNISSTAPSAPIPPIETITIPHELAVRLNNAAYFYGDVLDHIVRTFLPSIELASQCGNIHLVSEQLSTLENYILQYTEQHNGIRASIDFNQLEGDELLPRGYSEALAEAEIYRKKS